ncbi:FAD-dependent monooxygenase [Polymorphospora sp. NPDC050346]|uniref:FAD-dependent monooxygenase n=1 Tax=Polymorphospora sp. NPDC050346 TaxID=3155780 RepID=UPI0033D3EEEB
MSPTVLISGAGIAGPVLAYWLSRHGFTPTVVERAPGVRHTGGHAVDLGGVSTEVIERMGLLPAVQAARVRRDTLVFHRDDRPPLAMPRLSDLVTDRHVEIQRDDLISILHDATRDRTEYVFGETITAVHEHGDGLTVTFAGSPARDFDLLVGADGLHSGVRRLVFGPEQRFRHDLGGYLAVFSYPNELDLDRQVLGHLDVDRAVFTYAVDDGARARALLLFRHPAGADGHADDLRDPGRRTRLLRDVFGGSGWHLPRLLAHSDGADDLYLDSISQIRMDTWSRGRVTLVGDAGYSPGPAVGGGTARRIRPRQRTRARRRRPPRRLPRLRTGDAGAGRARPSGRAEHATPTRARHPGRRPDHTPPDAPVHPPPAPGGPHPLRAPGRRPPDPGRPLVGETADPIRWPCVIRVAEPDGGDVRLPRCEPLTPSRARARGTARRAEDLFQSVVSHASSSPARP